MTETANIRMPLFLLLLQLLPLAAAPALCLLAQLAAPIRSITNYALEAYIVFS